MGLAVPAADDLSDNVTGSIDGEGPRGFFPFITCIGVDVEIYLSHIINSRERFLADTGRVSQRSEI
jgi:hypothetical protein